MALSYTKNDQSYAVTTLVTVPAAANLTGTVQTVGIDIIGTGTSFLTQLEPGAWLWDRNTKLGKVDRVYSDTIAYLTRAFAVDIPALTACSAIARLEACNVRTLSLLNSGGASATVDGATVPAGTGWESSKASLNRFSQADNIDPVILNAAGTTVQVTIQR